MKRILFMALCFIPATLFAQESTNSFVLNAKVGQESAPTKAYLLYNSGGVVVKDSAVVDKGVFQLKGTLTSSPVQAQLILDHKGAGLMHLGKDPDGIIVFLEKGVITLSAKDSVKNGLITGSKINDDFAKYKASTAGPDKEMKEIQMDYNAASAEQKDEQSFKDLFQAKLSKVQDEKKALTLQFIKQNPDSYISLIALSKTAGPDLDIAVIEPLYKGLSAGLRNSPTGLALAKKIDAAKSTSIGAIAPDFTQNDVNDKPVSLKQFRGKYVLLDFWASWCGPCRGENPNVVKAYQQYKNKNFTILSVSLDQPGKKDAWLAAIKADGLEWTQVSDLQFWDNAVAKQYGVTSIPQNFLIDPTGKIIAKNLRGDDLNKQLAILFNK